MFGEHLGRQTAEITGIGTGKCGVVFYQVSLDRYE
jgi:hypothetical protein